MVTFISMTCLMIKKEKENGNVLARSESKSLSQIVSLVLRAQSNVSRPHSHQFTISAVEWYPADRGLFLSSSFDGLVKVWDTEALMAAALIDLGTKVHFCTFGRKEANHDLIAGMFHSY